MLCMAYKGHELCGPVILNVCLSQLTTPFDRVFSFSVSISYSKYGSLVQLFVLGGNLPPPQKKTLETPAGTLWDSNPCYNKQCSFPSLQNRKP